MSPLSKKRGHHKYHTPYTTKLNCKLVFATNHPIRAIVADQALARRLIILPFQYPIPRSRKNPELLHHLLNERDAILRRAVQAYQVLRANNYVFAGDDLFDNAAIMGISDEPAVPADMVEQFTDTCCIRAPEQFISTEQAYLHCSSASDGSRKWHGVVERLRAEY